MYGKQSEHSSAHVIVVEIADLPLAFVDRGGYALATEYEVLSLALVFGHFRFVIAIEELAIEQLHGNYSKTEQGKGFIRA